MHTPMYVHFLSEIPFLHELTKKVYELTCCFSSFFLDIFRRTLSYDFSPTQHLLTHFLILL